MKAVIMAGGEGSRLRPLTGLRPKPMVPIFNQPVMEHILGLVKHHGITDVVVTLQFMPQVIQDYFGAGEEWGMNIAYALEETPLGTAGSVKNAAEHLDDTFIVISGDALTDINLSEVIRFHREREAMVTLALKSVPDPLEYGVVITGEDGRIERFLEKPSWGQVFSDTINTGIYVVEPKALDFIPEGLQYDFSSELFPALMSKGFGLFGLPVEGYWCDIGSLQTYVQAHRDVMDGQAMVYIPGVRTVNEVWIGEGAEIDPDAVVGHKVVVGNNAKIRAGAEVGEYTIIGDNCIIGHDTKVIHSIIWDDSFVGAGSDVRGSVICRKVDVRKRARIEMGTAIGDESMIGHDAFIGTDVQVYPYKRVEPAAVVNSSIIWESRAVRTLFGNDGVTGLVGVDITPEIALLLAQAYGTNLPSGSHVIVSRDSSRAARMVKRAMVAGMNSSGINTRDLRVASSAINRFTTRATRCVGGVHVASAGDAQTLSIHFYDKDGLDLPLPAEKKVERLFFRREFRRAFLDEIGEIIYPPRALEYYAAGMLETLDAVGSGSGRLKVLADLGQGVASVVFPQVIAATDTEIVTFNPMPEAERTVGARVAREAQIMRMQQVMETFQADLGIVFDRAGECFDIVTPRGRALDYDTALHLMVSLWCRTDDSGEAVAVPISASRVVERIAGNRSVLRSGRSNRALAAVAQSDGVGFAGSQWGGYVFPSFLPAVDGVMAAGTLLRMLSTLGEDLDDIADALPDFYLRAHSVFCPSDKKGAVMRVMAEAASGGSAEMSEGIRISVDDGWVLVLPHASEPVVEVFSEGANDAAADEIVERYIDLVQETVAS